MNMHVKLLSEIFDDKIVKLLQCLLQKDEVVYLRDISRESGVSLATTHRIVQKLLKMGLVVKIVKDKLVYYKLNKSSPVFRELYQIIVGIGADPIKILKDKLKTRYGDKAGLYIRQDGKQIFVIGNGIQSEFLKVICNDIKRTTGVDLNVLQLSPAQFKQMKEMGLIE